MTKVDGLITTQLGLVEVLEKLEEKMDPMHVKMIREELRLSDTILKHITEEWDEVQITHLSSYLDNIDRFFWCICKGKETTRDTRYLTFNAGSVARNLENHKANMELKYSSVAAAELKIINNCIEEYGLDKDPIAADHLCGMVANVVVYMTDASMIKKEEIQKDKEL